LDTETPAKFKIQDKVLSFIMKKLWFAFIGCFLVLTACTGPSADEAQADLGNITSNTSVEETARQGTAQAVSTGNISFIGYGPGKSHEGTFDTWNATLYESNNSITSAQVTVDVASLDTGIGSLDSHLRGEDFFHTEEHPTARFDATTIENDTATGTLKMHGVTREISFPLNVTGNSVSSRFNLGLKAFNISHPAITGRATIIFDLERKTR
jgi:polyisoprenoid-binding protein YceI